LDRPPAVFISQFAVRRQARVVAARADELHAESAGRLRLAAAAT
jgi:hypothetical protein